VKFVKIARCHIFLSWQFNFYIWCPVSLYFGNNFSHYKIHSLAQVKIFLFLTMFDKYISATKNKKILWIRIRGSMPLTNGSGTRSETGCGSGSCYFHHWASIRQQKTNLKRSFSAYYFLKVHLHNFSKIKSKKDCRNKGFSYYFC
jgi:hypothetical protein